MVYVIIQARMGSSRLPGKILMDLGGKPSLYHVYHRSLSASKVDQVIIATSAASEDDQVEAFCRLNGFDCFRGSENDVLDRFYKAALNAGASKGDVVVRVTGDCPVIDPEIIDDVICGLEGGDFDYCSNSFERSYPDGLDAEAMTFETLEYVWKKATWQSEREHVTSYINRNRNEFRISHLKFDEDLSELRWTVDYEDDYEFVKKLYDGLYREDRIFNMEDILEFLKEHPELGAINNSHEINEGLKKSEGSDQKVLKGNNKFCLGTAQFGLNYGVANKNGKPALGKSLEVLNYAYDAGIRCFDTAQAYGTAEEILGKFIRSRNPEGIQIISKLLPHAFDKDSEWAFKDVEDSINASLKRLTVKELDGFLFHTPEYMYREDIVEQMIQCREKGLVKNIGVSIYEVEHALDAARMDWADYIQIPYSIFDQRLNHTEFFHLAKKNQKKVFARSAFLQGLTLMNVEDVHRGLEKAIVYLRVLDELCDKYAVSRLKVSELFSLNDDRIDFFVFGTETLAQLKEVLEIGEAQALPEALIKELRVKFSDIEREIVMPNLWKI